MSTKPKIVLYQSQQVNQDLGQFTSYDMLPLEMLHIAAIPDSEGYEVVIIDASLYSHEEAHRRAVEETKDALIFGTTAILGYMVADGHQAARKVKAANPHVKIIAGGWFPSCLPETYLESGVYDAVCLGQGELTFRDFIYAVEAGAPLDDVNGLALMRDGQVIRTDARTIVGWDQVKRAAWHLIDIEPYKERQLRPGAREARNRMPSPPSVGGNENYFGISYYSSFGCPEPCSFCCSPLVTNRRWKAQPAADILDDLEDLKARWGFQVVRFQDANFGVAEKRINEFAHGLIDRGMNIEWSTTLEVNNILRYSEDTLDALAKSGLYVACVGAETAEQDMMDRIGKPIAQETDDTMRAAREMHKRGIVTSLTYIIGYPGETEQSMLATLDQARRILADCPSVSAHVYPFRPIPGSDEYVRAVKECGYQGPKTLEEWGHQLEYHVMETWEDNIPESVHKRWRLYYQYASFMHGLVRKKRGLFEKIAEWRIKSGNYKLPLELKAFYLMDKAFGWGSHKEDEKQSWIMHAENDKVTMVDAAPAPTATAN